MVDRTSVDIERIKAAQKIVFFSGAGISAESGVPTFRDDLSGLWAQYDPMQLATPEAFQRQPALVWGWYMWRRHRVRQAQPNAAHLTIAAWQKELGVERVRCITQNVDDLFERAGCQDVLHMHGNLFASQCFQCGRPVAEAGWLTEHQGLGDEGSNYERCIEPPQCNACGGFIRPGVIWFGEALDSTLLERSFEYCAQCDVLIAVGTSGVVQPAATLPSIARDAGAYVLQINPHHTSLDAVAHCTIRSTAAHTMPALYQAFQKE